MSATKTLAERERELQALLANPEGRAELKELERRYHAEGANVRPTRTSLITYILVHERQKGLIVG